MERRLDKTVMNRGTLRLRGINVEKLNERERSGEMGSTAGWNWRA